MSNQNAETKAEQLRIYACRKYDREFTVVSFQAAKDETYTNILTLSDGLCNFNVYCRGNNAPSDDYPQAIVNRKFTDSFQAGNDCNIYANLIFADGRSMTAEYAASNDIDTICSDYSLLKIVLVVRLEDHLSSQSEELFQIYRTAMERNPKYIDFEVIEAKSVGAELEEMLNNLAGRYDNEWSKFPEIVATRSITDTDITSPDELVGRGE